jgi:hypothetical protein
LPTSEMSSRPWTRRSRFRADSQPRTDPGHSANSAWPVFPAWRADAALRRGAAGGWRAVVGPAGRSR